MRVIKQLTPYIPAAQIFSLFAHEKDCAFLDSSLVNQLGRYSILGLYPYLQLKKTKDAFTVNGKPKTRQSFEEYLDAYLEAHREENTTDLPLISGAIGYFSYDYGRKLQQIPSQQQKTVAVPDAVLTFYDVFLIEDCWNKQTFLVANGKTQPAQQLTETILAIIYESKTRCSDSPVIEKHCLSVRADFEQAEYEQAVRRMMDYMVAGDIYVANMTQQFEIHSTKSPVDVFLSLRKNNPSPFSAYMNCEDFQIISASPERFVHIRNGIIETRPIKGTRKRGTNTAEDQLLRQELQQSKKDRSELLMIVDLERNDLNRICLPGSVVVPEMFASEAYATVFHLVSTVRGQVNPNASFSDILRSVFPGGSITGAPKYRAMEIIDELERCNRNIYTGTLGYLSLDGNCDWNIIIRTALHTNHTYYLGVGGGITAQSDPAFEYEETLQKARAMLDALQ